MSFYFDVLQLKFNKVLKIYTSIFILSRVFMGNPMDL
jgi:hypothetical protein